MKLYTLTKRQEEILTLVAQGLANKEIAKLLNISVFTVNNHLQNMYTKITVKNRTEAVNMYWQQFSQTKDISKNS